MKLRAILTALAIVALTAGAAYAAAKFPVTANEFDPAHTFLVQAQWLHGIGCATNARVSADGSGSMRIRWGNGTILAFAANGPSAGQIVNISGIKVSRIKIVFDEGQDTGPDNFGLAVLDNVDVNGTLVGQGDNPDNNKGKNKDKDKDKGDDNDQGENEND